MTRRSARSSQMRCIRTRSSLVLLLLLCVHSTTLLVESFGVGSLASSRGNVITPSTVRTRSPPSFQRQQHRQASTHDNSDTNMHPLRLYWQILRPITIVQAVGAFVVGRLVISPTLHPLQDSCAALSIYIAYGAGMVMNDCADAHMDALFKQHRPIASGRISVRDAWRYARSLSLASLVIAAGGVNLPFAAWSASNLLWMALYAAGGWQRLFLIKNLIVGWLCISPLIAATLVTRSMHYQLYRMAMTGFAIGTAREILKDTQDVDMDHGEKSTIPLVLGVQVARCISMSMVLGTLAVLVTPTYRAMFAGGPWFSFGWSAAAVASIKACFASLDEQQSLVKKSIYFMLFGLIGGLLAQPRL